MIYHKWKLIFIGIPKNASTSFHMVLTNKTDYYQTGHNHDSIFEEFEKNDEDMLLHYDSLCVIRNPYDRFFSAWKFAHPHKGPISLNSYKESFNDFVHKCVHQKFRDLNIGHNHFFPQYKFVTMNKRIVVDDIIRYENLLDDWKQYQINWNHRRNLPYKMNLTLPHENNSEIDVKWDEVYDSESREIVYDLYHTDFEIFKYQK